MTTPLVTIGITAFNASDTIESALASALAQTWRPIEIVVVDDCSTDGTPDILNRLASCHHEIRLFRTQTNSGIAVARNHILAEARGEFVAFFDDDDRSVPERVEIQLNRILAYERDFANGEPVICHTACRQRYPDGRERIATTMGSARRTSRAGGVACRPAYFARKPLANGYGGCPTRRQMARLSVYRALGGFDPRFRRGSDTELNIPPRQGWRTFRRHRPAASCSDDDEDVG